MPACGAGFVTDPLPEVRSSEPLSAAAYVSVAPLAPMVKAISAMSALLRPGSLSACSIPVEIEMRGRGVCDLDHRGGGDSATGSGIP